MAIDVEKRFKIVELVAKGLNDQQISRELDICPKTVKRWRIRYQETGRMDVRGRPGRPRSSSKDDDIDITAMVMAEPFRCSMDVTVGVGT